MKSSILFALIIFTLGCANHKEQVQEVESHEELMNKNEEVEAVDTDIYTVGIVHISETDCPFHIDAKLKDGAVTLYPVNLDDKFKVNGLKIKFTYQISRGSMPSGCDLDLVVSVANVSIIE